MVFSSAQSGGRRGKMRSDFGKHLPSLGIELNPRFFLITTLVVESLFYFLLPDLAILVFGLLGFLIFPTLIVLFAFLNTGKPVAKEKKKEGICEPPAPLVKPSKQKTLINKAKGK